MKNSTESLEDPIEEIFQKAEQKEQEVENKRGGKNPENKSKRSYK